MTSNFKPNSKWKDQLKHHARELGFDYVGVSKAEFLEEDAPRLEHWLNQNYHGEMAYMANHFDKRLDPRQLVPGAKSVISFLYNYYSEQKQQDPSAPKIASYAYGNDYHQVIKEKLRELVERLIDEVGQFQFRIFVDSAPVLERSWASRSGLGWVGKNTNLITKHSGSYFFLAELICDLELPPDGPIKDYCGTCTACIEACPTNAIGKGFVDGSKCISYLTIELKDEVIPNEFQGQMANWMFGCDICQQVCPWNRFSTPNHEPQFQPKDELLSMTKRDWQDLTQEIFNDLFKHSAVKRAKYKGLMRNINFLNHNDE